MRKLGATLVQFRSYVCFFCAPLIFWVFACVPVSTLPAPNETSPLDPGSIVTGVLDCKVALIFFPLTCGPTTHWIIGSVLIQGWIRLAYSFSYMCVCTFLICHHVGGAHVCVRCSFVFVLTCLFVKNGHVSFIGSYV
jgi:hypothetical protein